MFRAFSTGWQITGIMRQPVTLLRAGEGHPLPSSPLAPDLTGVFLRPDAAGGWQVFLPDGPGEWQPCFSLSMASTPAQLVQALQAHPGRTAVLVDEAGHPAGIVAPADLAAAVWREMEQLRCAMDILMDTVNDAVTIIDQKNTVVGWNRKAADLYRITAETIIGQDIQGFFSSLVVTHVINTDLPKEKIVRNNYHQPLPGTHVLINAAPISCGGQVIGSVCAERDITETVQLHNELSKASSQVRQLKNEITKINRPFNAFEKIVGHSKKLQETISLAKRVANTNVAVLIRGESGTGKELFAEAIHHESPRHNKPFVVINCGAIPAPLLESELFGYQQGAFTGADRRGREGKFEAANGGTIFLDEIGEMPGEMQVKLLRVLQNKRFYRVGGNDPVDVDVRVIAATHRDLEQMIAEGTFREDLYYRINVVSVTIPPLRQRKEDIPELIYMFIREFCLQQGREMVQLAPEVMPAMLNYPWPGNIRELRNVVERMVIFAEEDMILLDHLPEAIRSRKYLPAILDGEASLTDITQQTERDIILQALETTGGDKSRAAKKLGVPRSTLYYKMNKFDIK